MITTQSVSIRWFTFAVGLVVLIGFFFGLPSASAMQTNFYVGPESGDWNNAANWTLGIPTADVTSIAEISNGNSVRILSDGAVSNWVFVGGPNGGNGGLVLSDGATLTNFTMSVGQSGSNGTGLGLLQVLSGSSISSELFVVAGPYGALGSASTDTLIGEALIDGSNSVVNAINSQIGLQGYGRLTVNNSGELRIAQRLGVGDLGPSSRGELNINGGGKTFAESTDVGFGTAGDSRGEINVDGSGSQLVVTNTLTVGRNGGLGTVTVANGGLVHNTTAVIGSGTNSNGTAVIEGLGSQWINSGAIVVGSGGQGSVMVSDGGLLQNSGASATSVIGQSVGGVGLVAIDGIGSRWDNAGAIFAGVSGQGELAISNGGEVSAAEFLAGNDNLGPGTLNINSGGKMTNTSAQLGRNNGASGFAIISGVGSEWTLTNFLNVGNFGFGQITLENGGKLTSQFVSIGAGPTATGEAVVTGTGTLLQSSVLNIGGHDGSGTLVVNAGGRVESVGSTIGTAAISVGIASVGDVGSTWINSSSIQIGASGNGQLTVTNGGFVQDASATIGSSSTAVGSVTVDGAGSQWINLGGLTVGNSGVGVLDIENVGSVVTSTFGRIGFLAGSVGEVNVNGSGSKWSIGQQLNIGFGGTGTLSVSNGGQVVVGTGSFTGEGVFIGADGQLVIGAGGTIETINFSNNGSSTISGAGSNWNITGNLQVGQFAGTPAILRIENAGTVSNSGFATLGAVVGSQGLVTVTGNNSKWTSLGDVTIGLVGAGRLTVDDGAQMFVGAGSFDGEGIYVANHHAIHMGVDGEIITSSFVVDGSLTGWGLINASLTINGMLDPGNSAGTTKVKGSLSLEQISTVCIEIGGTRSGLSYDVIDGQSSTELVLRDGALEVSLIDGFVPDEADVFDIFANFAAISGQFNTGDGDAERVFFRGGSLAIMYAENYIRLFDFQSVEIPEIGQGATLAIMVFVFFARKSRNRIKIDGPCPS